MYHAHARFLDARGSKITVAAPVDADTPDAPWFYDWISDHALDLASAGFTSILYPPVSKTQSGRFPTGDGYGVYDQYDLGSKNQCWSRETRFGNREQLQRSVAVCKACGLDVYVDVVMHQQSGGNNYQYRYLGADGKTKNGRFPKDRGCFRGPRPQDPVPNKFFDFAFGDAFVFVNCDPPRYTINGMIEYSDWLTRTLDLDGYRFDNTKGTAVSFAREWCTSKAMANKFVVGEYFEGNPDTLWWWCNDSGMQGRASTYDFTVHWAIKGMCDDPNFDMRRMQQNGYFARDPYRAVTFVDNVDTDLSGNQMVSNNKLLGYAYILTNEGYPSVAHKDYATEKGCYGLKPWIDNLVWIHEHLANGDTVNRYADNKAIVYERVGQPGLLVGLTTEIWGDKKVTVQTNFGANVQLHDYTGRHDDIWTDGSGKATFWIPKNEYGKAQSYVCFSRQWQGKANEVRGHATTQEFFGAADLDIPAAAEGVYSKVTQIWIAKKKLVTLSLHLHEAYPNAAAKALVRVLDPDNEEAAICTFTSAPNTYRINPERTGWHSLEIQLSGFGAAATSKFELKVQYTATQSL